MSNILDYFMPHSGVWVHKRQNAGESFLSDASSKRTNCLSLNDVIHTRVPRERNLRNYGIQQKMQDIIAVQTSGCIYADQIEE